MNRLRSSSWCALCAGLALACFGELARSSDEKKGEPPQAGPGPEHKLLKQLEGDWDATVKLGETPEGKATKKTVMGCGGLWLIEDFHSDVFGQKFHGHGVHGYDSAKKKFVSSWVDSMQHYLLLMEGGFDKEGKVLTLNGEGADPTGKVSKFKMVTEIKDKDNHTFTLSAPGPDAKDLTMMVITYKRKK